MSWSKITLIGFEQWLNAENKSLFDGLCLPEGIDKDVLCTNIIMEAGEFEVMYSNPDIMTVFINKWGLKWYRTFEKWVAALNTEYQPLWNYDRHEEWTDSGSDDRTLDRTINGSILRTGGYTTTDIIDATVERTDDLQQDTDGTVTNERSAFDSSTYQPHDKSTTDETITNTGTQTTDTDSTDTITNSNRDNTATSSLEGETEGKEFEHGHEGHLYGNIGVMSSQSLLLEELSVAEWNIYNHITDLFIKEFCIPVYE